MKNLIKKIVLTDLLIIGGEAAVVAGVSIEFGSGPAHITAGILAVITGFILRPAKRGN